MCTAGISEDTLLVRSGEDYLGFVSPVHHSS